MDIRILETIIALGSFLILRFVSIKIVSKIQKKYDYSKYRIRPILKSINLFVFITLVIVLVAVWGVEQTNILTFITSILTILGIALVAQWSILSNIASAVIIFIRFNGGGQDAVSFEILSRFIPKGKLQIATQKLRYGNRFTPLLPLYIDGNTNAFTKPVYVLTSKQTGSAAEALSIATMSMQHVKRIGSATSGAMSTALEKKLPNGWTFAISNEIYMDFNGKPYENIGVPVNYELNYPSERLTFFRSVVNELEADKQNILKAISKLEEK